MDSHFSTSRNDQWRKSCYYIFHQCYRTKKTEDESIIAIEELEFQNKEKEKHAIELTITNKELSKSEDSVKKLNQELEQKVAELTEQLELINKNISDYKFALDESCIVAVTDQKGTIQFVNDNFCKISKYTKDELVGQDHRIINSGYHPKEYIRDLWVTISNGKVWRGEMKNKAKDRTMYWVDTTIVPFLNKDGKPYKYLAIRSDITERMLSVESLKANEEKYHDLFENSLVAMFITDPKTQKTNYVNEIGVEFLGYKSREDFIENYDSIHHFINSADLYKMRQDILKDGIVKWNEVNMKKLDGTPFSAKLVSKLSADKCFVQTALTDITDHILYINALKAREDKSRLDEKRIRFLVENTPASVAMFDMQMRYLMVSKRWMEDYQLGDRDMIGISHYEVFPEISKKWKEFHNRSLAGEELECDQEAFTRANGKVEWIKWNLFPWYIEEGKIGGIILFSELITEQKLAEERLEAKVKDRTLELTDSLLREKELNEMKTRFVSFASHEFRTPLSIILSSSSLIEMYNKSEQEEQRLKHTNRIASSVKNLTDILNDFLAHGELEKGITQIEKSIFKLPEFIMTVVGELDGMVNEKKQQIIYDHNGETMIEQSGKILRNILLNLLSNASKYSPKEKEIRLTSSVTNNKVSISIKDHGIGIPEKDQKKLFDQFFRAGNVEHIQGTGLGLAIVKKYIELINGNIEFISKPGEGTTFTIEFPQKK